MYCKKCGTELKEGAKFCHKCGVKIFVDDVESGLNKSASGSRTVEDLFNVRLIDTGENKIKVIKVVQELTGFRLSVAKELVENIPVLLKRGVTEAEAQSAKQLLQEVGAKVTISTIDSDEDKEYYSMQDDSSGESPTMSRGIYCPKCKSNNLQTIVETNVQSKGGGFGVGKGFLGYILFGPLGLLCGACGSKAKIISSTKNYFVCSSCGYKFREASEFAQEEFKSGLMAIFGGIGIIILGIFILQDTVLWAIAAVILGGLLICAGFIAIKQSEEIKDKKYESESYKDKESK